MDSCFKEWTPWWFSWFKNIAIYRNLNHPKPDRVWPSSTKRPCEQKFGSSPWMLRTKNSCKNMWACGVLNVWPNPCIYIYNTMCISTSFTSIVGFIAWDSPKYPQRLSNNSLLGVSWTYNVILLDPESLQMCSYFSDGSSCVSNPKEKPWSSYDHHTITILCHYPIKIITILPPYYYHYTMMILWW